MTLCIRALKCQKRLSNCPLPSTERRRGFGLSMSATWNRTNFLLTFSWRTLGTRHVGTWTIWILSSPHGLNANLMLVKTTRAKWRQSFVTWLGGTTDENQNSWTLPSSVSLTIESSYYRLIEHFSDSHTACRAENVLNGWDTLVNASTRMYNSLPSNTKPSFFQTVHHPVIASANLNRMLISAGMNNLRASQARLSTNNLADLVQELFENDYDFEVQYHTMLDGKTYLWIVVVS